MAPLTHTFDRLVDLVYRDALDDGDLETMAELWRLAEADPDLARALCLASERAAIDDHSAAHN